MEIVYCKTASGVPDGFVSASSPSLSFSTPLDPVSPKVPLLLTRFQLTILYTGPRQRYSGGLSYSRVSTMTGWFGILAIYTVL